MWGTNFDYLHETQEAWAEKLLLTRLATTNSQCFLSINTLVTSWELVFFILKLYCKNNLSKHGINMLYVSNYYLIPDSDFLNLSCSMALMMRSLQLELQALRKCLLDFFVRIWAFEETYVGLHIWERDYIILCRYHIEMCGTFHGREVAFNKKVTTKHYCMYISLYVWLHLQLNCFYIFIFVFKFWETLAPDRTGEVSAVLCFPFFTHTHTHTHSQKQRKV